MLFTMEDRLWGILQIAVDEWLKVANFTDV